MFNIIYMRNIGLIIYYSYSFINITTTGHDVSEMFTHKLLNNNGLKKKKKWFLYRKKKRTNERTYVIPVVASARNNSSSSSSDEEPTRHLSHTYTRAADTVPAAIAYNEHNSRVDWS